VRILQSRSGQVDIQWTASYGRYDFALHEETHGGVHAVHVALEGEFEVVLCFIPL
jgi:hypothetical protein